MADSKVAWKTALTPQKAPTYGNQAMIITCPDELHMFDTNYIVVFEGTKKYHVTTAKIINPYTLHVLIPEHDTAEEVTVEVYVCQKRNSSMLTSLKFTYVSQMEHAIAKFLAQTASEPEVAEKLDAVWTVCSGKDHVDLWDKRLAQAFAQLELPLDWTLVGNVLESDTEFCETLLHFAANHGLKELIKVFLERPGAKLALSKCNKSGLLPRDVARENGRPDLVELLDSERFDERSKAKDANWCKVRQNKEYGVKTISNAHSGNKRDDVLLLHELNKLAQPKNGSPTWRHSWPGKAESSHADTYFDELEYKLGKNTFAGERKSDVERPFLDGNLICLRDVTEELSQLRALNSQTTSSEISVIAERNRAPMHSRRLSCPASVSRKRKMPSQDFSKNSQTLAAGSPKLQVGEKQQDTIPCDEQLLSTPPHSPVVGQLVDLSSTVTIITPPLDEPPSPYSELTTTSQSEAPTQLSTPVKEPASQEPTSPMPISYKFPNVERRTAGRKNRPSTWYGGPAVNGPNEEEMLRRSNSLEDFAKKLAQDGDSDDDESVETTSKEDLLQTISCIVDTVDRKESFLSSLSDLSTGKDSIESEGEMEQEGDSDDDGERDEVDGIAEDRRKQDVEDDKEKHEHDASEKHRVDEQVEDNREHEEHREEQGGHEEDHEGDKEEHREEPKECTGVQEGHKEQSDSEDHKEYEEVEQDKTKHEEHRVDYQEHEELEGHKKEREEHEEGEDDKEDRREHEENNEELEEHMVDREGHKEVKEEYSREHEEQAEDHKEHEDVPEDKIEREEHGEEDNEEHRVDHEEDGEKEEDGIEHGKQVGDREQQEDDREKHNDLEEDKWEHEERAVEREDKREHEGQVEDREEQVEGHEEHVEEEGHEEHEEYEEKMEHEGQVTYREEQDDLERGNRREYKERREDNEEQDESVIMEHKGILRNGDSRVHDDANMEKDENKDDEELRVNEEQYREASGIHEAHVEHREELGSYDRREGTDEYSEIRKTGSEKIEENHEKESSEHNEEGLSGDQVLDERLPLEHAAQNGPATTGVPFAHEKHLCSQESIQEEPEHFAEDEVSRAARSGGVAPLEESAAGGIIEPEEKPVNQSSQKHIRFSENMKQRSQSTIVVPDSSRSSFRERSGAVQSSAILLTLTKTPVKRSGSDVSVTSLQDVQLDVHNTATRDEDLSAIQSNLARKAKSFGDLSSFRDTSVHMKDDDSDEDTLEEERHRIHEDHKQLSVQRRIKKFEDSSKYGGSTEKINQLRGCEDEEQGKRRWSNFFNAKNPKATKKPSRTPTFRRDNLRSSMSNIVGRGSGKKGAIESLVQNQAGVAMATKQSLTAPATSNVAMVGRPRSWTKESPASARKFLPPGQSGNEADDVKPTSTTSESPPDDTPSEEPGNDFLDLEVDSDLENFDREPETWCETVEKKTMSKMSKKEIKRQDIILELIKTEHHHVRTLKIMQQVFYRGLNKWANYPWEKLDQLFPRINELVDLSVRFHMNLRCRQDQHTVVESIGDLVVKHFSGENGEAIVQAYGEFVSKHQEGVAMYKHYFKTDKKFANFIKKCHGNRIVRRLSIPECFTLVTQRLTKYPPLIEAIMKVTKSSSAEHKELAKALTLVKQSLQAVDNAIKDYEKQTKLKEIKSRMEKGSVVLKSGIKIKNSRFSDDTSKMVADGTLNWRSARGKLAETHVVLLDSMVVFLQENDKKFTLLSVDGKAPCIALKTLMVREVATDKNAIYFVSTSANERREPEMYEFVCGGHKEKKQWLATISDAISKAPEDIGDLFQSPEEERRLAEERLNRRNEILEIMKTKDQELSRWVEEKNSLCSEMKELLNALNGNEKAKEEEKILTSSKVRDILLAAIRRTTQLTADSVQHLHESHSDSELASATHDEKANASPKRAETFGGFDRRPTTAKLSRRQESTISEGGADHVTNHVSHRRDSGFITESYSSALNILNQGQDSWGPGSFLQILEALQWVLNQFNLKETALENLRSQLQSAVDEVAELRLMKQNEDKKRVLMAEEHQAELARQKKAQVELDRTFMEKIDHLEENKKLQDDKYLELKKNLDTIRERLMRS